MVCVSSVLSSGKFAALSLDPDPAGALFYTSPLEQAGSAMEMSAISGANAAALTVNALGLRSSGSDHAVSENGDANSKIEL